MIIAETERLIIRNWRDEDRDLAYEINSDDRVMEFFPFRRNRVEADAFFERVRSMIADTGLGLYVLELKASGEAIGYCGLIRTDHLEPFVPVGTVEIGWRLVPQHWGEGFVSEAARTLLAHGFEMLNLDRIVSFAVHNNVRSTSVMERIGMHRIEDGDFDHPGVPDTYPHLKRHVLYSLAAAEWRLQQAPKD
ncbi:GNAT family N-acetyltransferase [Agrobacterium rhizogenes]|uniref:Acetyltransferase n=1 Tax=Rhizobium rhizogenes NBRC 13257 TaxID=1220581 RepID=A0AA87U1W8_RHIRH|nr:GNAT family N-acetyltransferase [Rhizobium rhizogenes]OCJ26040.1 GNAT family acetyltransferase [Agrobacterium sp. B131/95]OCJ30860.1 GNAT family acetyltransferase [Agrobacterium sp. B133/95]MDJ1636048.1 GNAT family N-acetyltransferase [Rhizobium rhizogenes]NTF55573.1 GNAT family N-acetyltransferase [Rhizobium rhizogenes]NTF61932.1 GNAT family N-acetyltransferase [Rhizobium rhizogenes]